MTRKKGPLELLLSNAVICTEQRPPLPSRSPRLANLQRVWPEKNSAITFCNYILPKFNQELKKFTLGDKLYWGASFAGGQASLGGSFPFREAADNCITITPYE